MASLRAISLHCSVFFIVAGLASSTPIARADEILQTPGRSLLQHLTHCDIIFESMNFTRLMADCNGPTYTYSGCCVPMKDLACPVKDKLNDLTTDCAQIFFISCVYGTPPGLFATLCKEGEHGLKCNDGGEISVEAMQQGLSSKAGRPNMEITLFLGLCLIVMFFSQ